MTLIKVYQSRVWEAEILQVTQVILMSSLYQKSLVLTHLF